MRCCKKTAEAKDKMMMDNEFKECFDMPKDPVKVSEAVEQILTSRVVGAANFD